MTDLTREGLVELAERVEQASGPDRELDILIAHAVHPFLSTGIISPEQIRDECPAYTASMDAALSLEPEEHTFALYPASENRRLAQMWHVGRSYCGYGVDIPEARAVTDALAITAASLRARAMEAGRG